MKRLALLLFIVPMILISRNACSQQDLTMLLLPKAGAADSSLLYLSRGLNAIFLTDVSTEMEKNYPCVGITDPKAIAACLGELRLQSTPAFGGRDVRPVVDRIANSLTNPDFAVKYSTYVFSEERAEARVTCANNEGEILADFTESFSPGEVTGEAIISPVKKLMDQLKKHEICPFTGTVNIEVTGERDESSSSSTPCDAGLIVTDVEIKSNSTLRWELVKESLAGASGTVTYDLKENFKTVISNSCYVCEDGTKGFAKITETKESEAKVQGLSNESVSDGAQVSDARIRLSFLDDGTYLLTVKATSEKGPMKITTEKKVDGPCTSSNENEPPDTKNKSIDVPFTAVFGPYKGTPQDRVLSQNEEKDVSQGKEKARVKIDFTLTRQ
jgi:hypothetical protein